MPLERSKMQRINKCIAQKIQMIRMSRGMTQLELTHLTGINEGRLEGGSLNMTICTLLYILFKCKASDEEVLSLYREAVRVMNDIEEEHSLNNKKTN